MPVTAIASRRCAHLRSRLSSNVPCKSGRASKSGTPGKPAPVPTSSSGPVSPSNNGKLLYASVTCAASASWLVFATSRCGASATRSRKRSSAPGINRSPAAGVSRETVLSVVRVSRETLSRRRRAGAQPRTAAAHGRQTRSQPPDDPAKPDVRSCAPRLTSVRARPVGHS